MRCLPVGSGQASGQALAWAVASKSIFKPASVLVKTLPVFLNTRATHSSLGVKSWLSSYGVSTLGRSGFPWLATQLTSDVTRTG